MSKRNMSERANCGLMLCEKVASIPASEYNPITQTEKKPNPTEENKLEELNKNPAEVLRKTLERIKNNPAGASGIMNEIKETNPKLYEILNKIGDRDTIEKLKNNNGNRELSPAS